MLTLYYAGTTFLQSWRIQKVCHKIAEQLTQQTSVAFYALQPGNDDGFDTAFATSELCVNRNAAKVTEILWLHGNQRGCCLRPLQKLHITPWISFQAEPSWLPFAHETGGESSSPPALADDKSKRVNLLLEADIEPTRMRDTEEDEVRLEEYGKLIAWKIDSHLAVLIETDVEHFTKLLISTFLRNNLLINDQLPLLRIESVQHEGKPQPFALLAEHLRRSTRTTAELNDEAWQQHLSDLRALSVLAHQATEFEYNKNRTEGKTAAVKPDLIPHEKKAVAEVEKTKQASVDAPKASPLKADLADDSTKLIKAESSVTQASPSNVASANVSKLKAKPTEIRKPGASVTDGRFTSTRVSESPPSKSLPPESATSVKSITKASSKTSELEKIAAASLTKKQKSPVHAISSSQESTPTSSAASKATTATPQKSALTTSKMPVEIPTKLTSPKSTKETTAAATEQPKAITPKKFTPATIDDTESATASQQPSSSSTVSATEPNAKRPILRRNKDSLHESKPLNVLVYSDSLSARDSTVATLRELLKPDMYTVYAMTPQEAEKKYWLDQTALLVVCGSVAPPIGEILVDYFLHGGKVLSLCSDILHIILPTYRTAEVREHELVQFSYDKWHKVKMMHHIFCYQPSPVKKHFSTESEESSHSRKPALVCPRSIELKDLTGQPYKLDVQVLGTEETWNTPSLLLASSLQSGGKAVFSQVHLETNPNEFEFDESTFVVLKESEKIRLEIFADLLRKYLSVEVRESSDYGKGTGVVYKQAYFLGRYESKFDLIEKLKALSGSELVVSSPKLTLKFVGKSEQTPSAGRNLLPILIHSCPEDFSTVEYFDNLKTKDIGRLVIYAPVVSSSIHVIGDLELSHGIAVIPRHQTDAVGRSSNQWLSPPGCVMFSVQLHINKDSPLTPRFSLLQHVIGAAMANTLRSHELYGVLDIALKWPNDIYANGFQKIGGLVVNTTLKGSIAIVNLGCAINLDNSKPTVCINDLITDYNRNNLKKLPLLKYEQFLAMTFNEIERLVNQVQTGDFDSFYELYYSLWLHDEQPIKICTKNDQQQEATIVGIDEFGFLKVKLSNGSIENVQPDGNSFDMMKGLIVPKYH